MKPAELLRAVRKLGRDRNVAVVFVANKGKGSHGTLYYGGRRTTLKTHGDIGKGLLHGMPRDLGIARQDI